MVFMGLLPITRVPMPLINPQFISGFLSDLSTKFESLFLVLQNMYHEPVESIRLIFDGLETMLRDPNTSRTAGALAGVTMMVQIQRIAQERPRPNQARFNFLMGKWTGDNLFALLVILFLGMDVALRITGVANVVLRTLSSYIFRVGRNPQMARIIRDLQSLRSRTRASPSSEDASRRSGAIAEEPSLRRSSTHRPGRDVSESTPSSSISRSIPGEPDVFVFGRQERDLLIEFWQDCIRVRAGTTRSREAIEALSGHPSLRTQHIRQYIRNLQEGTRPAPRQSEIEIRYLYRSIGVGGETSYRHGSAIRYGARGSTRPDITGSGFLGEIKNYYLFDNSTGAVRNRALRRLITTLRTQIRQRAIGHRATISRQTIILDLRGQNTNPEGIRQICERISSSLSDELTRHLGRPVEFRIENIQVIL